MIETLLKEQYPGMELTDNVRRWIDLKTRDMSRKHMLVFICSLLMEISKREIQLNKIVDKDFDSVIKEELEAIVEEMGAVNI